MTERIGCVVPALDAAATLGEVARGVRTSLGGALLVVVDDGSRDATADVARTVADDVVRHPANLGKGAALRSGIARALDAGCDVVVTLDADGQHPPACLPALVERLGTADLVIGRRRRAGTAMPLERRASNAMSSAIASLLAGQHIHDSQSGFRAMRAIVPRTIVGAGDRFDYELDLLVRAARAGFRVAEVPVPTVYEAVRDSHFRHVRDTVLLMRAMVRLGLSLPG